MRWVLEHRVLENRVHGGDGESRGGTRGLQERGCWWCVAESGTAEAPELTGPNPKAGSNDPL